MSEREEAASAGGDGSKPPTPRPGLLPSASAPSLQVVVYICHTTWRWRFWAVLAFVRDRCGPDGQ